MLEMPAPVYAYIEVGERERERKKKLESAKGYQLNCCHSS